MDGQSRGADETRDMTMLPERRDPELGSPLQEFIAAIIVPALVNRWRRDQGGRADARDTAPDQKPVAVWDTAALP